MMIADMQFTSSLLLTGPAGQQLGIGPSSLPNRLGPATFEVGIVAGDRSLNPCFSYWIPGPDDGKVSVRSTTLEGMQDFLLIHRSHTWMMWRKDPRQRQSAAGTLRPAFDTRLTLSIRHNSLPPMPFGCGALEHFDTSPVSMGPLHELSVQRRKNQDNKNPKPVTTYGRSRKL